MAVAMGGLGVFLLFEMSDGPRFPSPDAPHSRTAYDHLLDFVATGTLDGTSASMLLAPLVLLIAAIGAYFLWR